MKQQIAIIHFNTPELTEACVKSIRKHGCFWPITILDNSTERPFTAAMKGVTVLDNTKGKIVDFDAELAKFPELNRGFGKASHYASTKHEISVQKLWELLPDGFILVESDVLIKKDISEMWREEFAAAGGIQEPRGYRYMHARLLPMVCYMNVPKLTKYGAKYFDPKRTFGLFADADDTNNWYDTGAPLLEDIRKTKPELVTLVYKHITHFYEHYRHGSWAANSLQEQQNWLKQHRDLWEPNTDEVLSEKVAVCVIGRLENRYAPEFVDHYKKLGVDKIYIYDNNRGNEEHFEDVLAKQIKSGLVEVVNYRDIDAAQHPAYNDCYAKHRLEYQWIMFVDFDEQLVLPKGVKIKKWLNQFAGAQCVLVNWQVMTDNNLVTDDGRKCSERFTTPIADDLKRADGHAFNTHVKCIVRGGMRELKFLRNPHVPTTPKLICVNADNKKCAQSPYIPIADSQVRFRHYITKTIQEYIENKSKRLFPLGRGYDNLWKQTAMANFWIINERTPEKDAWLNGKPEA